MLLRIPLDFHHLRKHSMDANSVCRAQPGLLVSVRNLAEAELVESCGVDILDIKEPGQGALGRADLEVIRAVTERLRGRVPLSAALGEIADCENWLAGNRLPDGLDLAKCGLSDCVHTDWAARVATVWERIRFHCQPVAVAYADWERCAAPAPEAILELAIRHHLKFLLVDTFDKQGPDSIELLSVSKLVQLKKRAAAGGVRLVLAGGLGTRQLAPAVNCEVDLIGVRGAVCAGGRESEISAERLAEFQHQLAAACQLCQAPRQPVESRVR